MCAANETHVDQRAISSFHSNFRFLRYLYFAAHQIKCHEKESFTFFPGFILGERISGLLFPTDDGVTHATMRAQKPCIE